MKRFYKETAVDAAEGGFRVLLDGKPTRTLAKAVLVVPTERWRPPSLPNGGQCPRRKKSRPACCRSRGWLPPASTACRGSAKSR